MAVLAAVASAAAGLGAGNRGEGGGRLRRPRAWTNTTKRPRVDGEVSKTIERIPSHPVEATALWSGGVPVSDDAAWW